jgi:hypothetical protein
MSNPNPRSPNPALPVGDIDRRARISDEGKKRESASMLIKMALLTRLAVLIVSWRAMEIVASAEGIPAKELNMRFANKDLTAVLKNPDGER